MTTNEIKSIKNLRSAVKGQLTKLLNIVCAITEPDPEDIDAYRARLTRAKDLFKEFEDLDKELITADPEQTSQTEDLFETYVKVESTLKQLIRKCTPTPSNNDTTTHPFHSTAFNVSHNSETKLPKLVIPKFNGDPLHWQTFFDLFKRAVHDNTSISPAQKMGHLMTLLTNEAEKVIHHLPISDANYAEALKLLKQRFDKKHHIVNSYIRMFLNLTNVRHASPSELRNLVDTTNQVIRGLGTLGQEAEGRDIWLVYLLINKLDVETQSLWAQANTEREFPSLSDLLAFLERRSDALDSIKTYANQETSRGVKPKTLRGHMATSFNKCSICANNDHNLYACPKFQQMNVQQRRQCAKADNRCFNCLTGHHGVFRCISKFRCAKCGRKHHTLLHTETAESTTNASEQPTEKQSTAAPPAKEPNLEATTNSYLVEKSISQAILPTALVNITNGHGQKTICRVLLDSGSISSFISESCCQRLQLPRKNGRMSVTGVGNVKAGNTNGIASLFITPLNEMKYYLEVDAYILPIITGKLPEFTTNRDNLNYLADLELADPYFNVSSEIDVLIGVEHFFQVLKSRQISGTSSQPIAQETIFGWIIGGKWDVAEQKLQTYTSTMQYSNAQEESVDKLLKKFWEVEEVNTTSKLLSEDEEKCEAHFKANTIRENGRFVVKLPLRENRLNLGTSLPLAISCFKSVERKLLKDKQYHEQYVKFMDEYESLGHMKEVPEVDAKKPGYFIPHHGIMKINDNGIKFRVVFNASAKTSSGESLNDQMLVGPTVQSSLYSIIVRFRQHKYVFSCDIEKMYRQFRIHPDNYHLQRIVWRKSPDEPIKQ